MSIDRGYLSANLPPGEASAPVSVRWTGAVSGSYTFTVVATVVPLPPGDVNCSGQTNSADIIYLVNYVFKGGAVPCDPCSPGPAAE